MTAALIWKLVTSRLAGPIATAVAVVLGFLLVTTAFDLGAAKRANGRLQNEAEGWKTAAARHEATARGWKAAFEQSERLRAEEQTTAVAASEAGEAACSLRIATARRSAVAINDIVSKETTRDAKGCPDRRLVPVERLRDALAPAG